MAHNQEKKQTTEKDLKMTRIMKLADSDYKTVIINMFKDLKKKMTVLGKQMGNFNIEIERKKESNVSFRTVKYNI